jgi:hypothetical protein
MTRPLTPRTASEVASSSPNIPSVHGEVDYVPHRLSLSVPRSAGTFVVVTGLPVTQEEAKS